MRPTTADWKWLSIIPVVLLLIPLDSAMLIAFVLLHTVDLLVTDTLVSLISLVSK